MQYESFVLCDDVRFEASGKLIFVGVYSDIVQVVKLPLQMRSLGLAIKARATGQGRFGFSASIQDPQGNLLLEAGGELNYDGEPGRTIWLPVVMGPALLTIEGPYTVRIRLGETEPVSASFLVRKSGAPEISVAPSKPN